MPPIPPCSSKECQKQHWLDGHKQSCRPREAAAGGGEKAGEAEEADAGEPPGPSPIARRILACLCLLFALSFVLLVVELWHTWP